MTRTVALLAALGLVALGAMTAGASTPPKHPRMTVNPSNGNPISSWSLPAMSRAQLTDLVRSVGFPESAIAKAVAIAMRESGGHPDAVVDTRGMTSPQLLAYWGKPAIPEWSAGLWQVNVLGNPGYDVESLKDPETAARAALALSHGGTSWAAWGG